MFPLAPTMSPTIYMKGKGKHCAGKCNNWRQVKFQNALLSPAVQQAVQLLLQWSWLTEFGRTCPGCRAWSCTWGTRIFDLREGRESEKRKKRTTFATNQELPFFSLSLSPSIDPCRAAHALRGLSFQKKVLERLQMSKYISTYSV